MPEDIYIKSDDLCDRCAFGFEQCRGACDLCAMRTKNQPGGTCMACLCFQIAPYTPCPYFKEATNEGK